MAGDPGLTEYLSPPLRDWLARPLAGESDPDILLLAGLICTPPIVPYQLLRRMRRSVLERSGTLAIEGKLCSAWFIESLAPDGFVFEPDFVHQLRVRLRGGLVEARLTANRDELRHIIDQETAGLSPLLRIEEQLCWTYSVDADFQPAVDKVFTDVAHTILQENRMQILNWASGALARLPREIATGSGAWVLMQLCRAAGLPHPIVEWPADGVDEALLRKVLVFLPDALMGIHRNGEILEIGTVTHIRRTAFPVPAVSPKHLTIEAETGTCQIVLDPAVGPTSVVVGRSAVSIRDMRGRIYRLAPFTSDIAPEESAVDEALTELDRRWRAGESMDVVATRLVERGSGIIVSFPDYPGFTGFLPASKAGIIPFSFRRMQKLVDSLIRVRVINFDRRSQRVVVERVKMSWSIGSLKVGDEFDGPVINKVNFGVFVSYAAAAGLPESESIDKAPGDGLVYKTELSWTSQYDDAKTFPVQIGEMVRVRVIDIDMDRQRVSLSIKQAQPDPWIVATRTLHVGDRITSSVAKVVPFGWFLRIADGVDGLLHTSEAPAGSAFELGTDLRAWVLAIDREQRRVSFTLRPPPW